MPPSSRAKEVDHHASSPVSSFPPTVPKAIALDAQRSPVVRVPHYADELYQQLRPRAFGREPIHYERSPNPCNDFVKRLDTLARTFWSGAVSSVTHSPMSRAQTDQFCKTASRSSFLKSATQEATPPVPRYLAPASWNRGPHQLGHHRQTH